MFPRASERIRSTSKAPKTFIQDSLVFARVPPHSRMHLYSAANIHTSLIQSYSITLGLETAEQVFQCRTPSRIKQSFAEPQVYYFAYSREKREMVCRVNFAEPKLARKSRVVYNVSKCLFSRLSFLTGRLWATACGAQALRANKTCL